MNDQQLPIFYINISTRQDRRLFMEKQFADLGLRATRIEAVTPARVPDDYRLRYGDPRRYQWLTPTELACSLSHVAALGRVAASGSPLGVVFEDDVVLSSDLPRVLHRFCELRPPVDILRIETANEALRLIDTSEFVAEKYRTARAYSWCAGSGGYIVSSNAAARLASNSAMHRYVVDDALFNPFRPIGRQFRVRQLTPALCIQTNRQAVAPDLSSDIERERQGRAAAERQHQLSSFLRRFLLVLDRDISMGTRKTWHGLFSGAKKRQVMFVP